MSNLESIFNKWSIPLSQLGEGALDYVISELDPMYEDKNLHVLPEKGDVFSMFRMLEPKDLRVVVIGQDPFPTPGECVGYAFSNRKDTIKVSKSLQKIQETIENQFYNGLNLDFDITLTNWAQQGILAFNTAFTVEAYKSGSHTKIWSRFTEILMCELSRNFNELIFCFWGKQAETFSYLVDPTKHYILTCYHPAYAVRQGKKWNCNHFEKINEYLTEPIKW